MAQRRGQQQQWKLHRCLQSLLRRAHQLAQQLNVECTDGTPEADCVPRCAEEFHGYQLLLNIGGEDSKMSCELHHEPITHFEPASRVVCARCAVLARAHQTRRERDVDEPDRITNRFECVPRGV